MATVTSSVTVERRQYTGTAQNPGVYGPFRIDKFTSDDADKIRITFMYEPTWPAIPSLFSVELKWEDDAAGAGATFSGTQPQKMGVLFDRVIMQTSIPRRAGVKRNVTRGDVSMRVFANFFTTVIVEALKD